MVPGVVLAGGRSVRLGGGDKCLLPLGGDTILGHVLAALRHQTNALAVNSNSDAGLFGGLEVLADVLPGRLGPLAGIHAAMVWARGRGAEMVLTVPGDTPFLPLDLLARLAAGRAEGQAVVAVSGAEIHPVVGLWPCALAEALEAFLGGGVYRVQGWLERIAFLTVEFDVGGVDPFWNINTPEDLRLARKMVAR